MTRLKFDLGSLGVAQGQVPTSLATCWAFLTEFRNSTESQKLYLNAAAIGAANQTDKLPRYPYSKGDPITYGYQICELLFKHKITPSKIVELGDPVLAEMFKKAYGIVQDEVTEKENFTSQGEEN